MKILYLVTLADMGGSQKYVLALANHFRGAIAAGAERGELFEAAEKAGVEHYKLKHLRRNIEPIHDLLAFFEILKLIKKLQPDLVHVNTSKAAFLGSLAGKIARKKVVFTAHGLIFHEPGLIISEAMFIKLERFASRFRDYAIAVSEADYQFGLKHRIIKFGLGKRIHNGLEQVRFISRADAQQKLGLSDAKFLIGTIANLYHRKGIDSFITAIKPLANKDEVRIVIIGEGPERPKLEELITTLGLENTVILKGEIAKASTYLKAFDLFVLPSRKEGFPYVLLEAMQAGLPILATDVGGNSEALGAGCGMIVPSDSPSHLTTAIRELMANKDLREKLANQALSQSKIYSLERMLEQTAEVYSMLGFEQKTAPALDHL